MSTLDETWRRFEALGQSQNQSHGTHHIQNDHHDRHDHNTDGATVAVVPPPAFSYISLAQLLAQPEPLYRFIVADLLPIGGTSLLVAKPKVGKSTLAQQLVRDVAAGTPFLAREVLQGTVLFHAFEEKDTEVARAFRRANAACELPIFFHFGEVPEERFTALETALTAFVPAMVILDTLAYWLGLRDFNDYAQVSEAMRPLHHLARESGAHIMAVHHMGKGGLGPLGSTAFSGNADTIMELRETEQRRTLETWQRYGPALPRTLLAFDAGAGTLSLGPAMADVKQRSFEEEVLVALGGQALTDVDLRAQLHCDRTHLFATLGTLVADVLVVRSGTGRKNHPYRYEAAGGPADGTGRLV